MSNAKNASSTFREGLKPYRQRKPRPLPSKSKVSRTRDWKSVLKDVVDATKFVVGLVNTQNKICDTTNSGTVTNTGLVFPLSLMAQGSDVVQRLGEEIHPKEMDVRMSFSIGTATGPSLCRVIVVRDRNCNGAVPAVVDVLNLITPAPMSHFNYLNFQGDDLPRFDILLDETFAIAPSSDQNQILLDRIKFPEDSHIHYLGPSSVNANLGKNNLFALVISDQSALGPTFTWASRLNYLSF